MGTEVLIAAGISFAISAATTTYQVVQAKKMKEKAKDAADARKGFEVVTEGNPEYLPIAYGRCLVGGVRCWATTISDFKYTPSNADRSYLTGESAVNSYSYNYSVFGESLDTLVPRTANVGGKSSGYLDSDLKGGQNDFMLLQQTMCVGPINRVRDVVVDGGRYLNDPTLGTYGKIEETKNRDKYTGVKAALRVDYKYYGVVPDSIIVANAPERKDALFDGMAYLSAVIRLDRDNPQFQGAPAFQSLIEGRLVRWVENGVLSTTLPWKQDPSKYRYDNSPALCLLDYMLDAENGGGYSLDEIDLDSFERSDAVCRRIVQTDVIVGGKFWHPTDGDDVRATRSIPLYECNILVDTSKPVRENLEAILSTMGDARLVWSGGKYRLSLQYPSSNQAVNIAVTLDDDELALDQEAQIDWPDAQSRYNFVTIRFHNEFENFKEDSVSWPPKHDNTYTRGIGGNRYSYGVGSWGDDKETGRLLNAYSVWDGQTNNPTMTWLINIDARDAGSYNVQVGGDDASTSMTIERIGGGNVLSLVHNRDWKSATAKGDVNLSVGQYKITVIGNNTSTGGKTDSYGVAAKIENGNRVLWTTRDVTYDAFINVVEDSSVYRAMLSEDNGVELEADIFGDGITDPQHALAKAEELCRTSRSATSFKLKHVVTDYYLEPGDYCRLSSETLNLGQDGNLIIRLDSSKLVDEDVCEIEATRFDASQLAWNVKDDVYITPPSMYGQGIPPPNSINYSPADASNIDSSGRLDCDPVVFSDFAGYVWYVHRAGIDATENNGEPIYTEIARTTLPYYILPKIDAASAFFGVRTLSTNGRMSVMTTTNPFYAAPLDHNWTRSVRIVADTYAFLNRDGITSPAGIVAFASTKGYLNPTYQWAVDDVNIAGATQSSFLLNKSTDPIRRLTVLVQESNELQGLLAEAFFTYGLDDGVIGDINDLQSDIDNITFDIERMDFDIEKLQVDTGDIAVIRQEVYDTKTNLVNEINRAKEDTAAIRVTTGIMQTDISGNASRIEHEELVRASGDAALNLRVDNMNTVVGQNTAAINQEAFTRSTADEAAAGRMDAMVAQYTGINTTLNGRIDDESFVRADSDSVLASRSSVLESSYSRTIWINKNHDFSIWTDPNALPYWWHWWAGPPNGYLIRDNDGTNSSIYNLRLVQTTDNAEFGVVQDNFYSEAGWYVIEATVNFLSGDNLGSGLLIYSDTNDASINFAAEPDTQGNIGRELTYLRTFTKLVYIGTHNIRRLHLMNSWKGFATYTPNKSIQWMHAGIRRATDGEIKGGKALVQANDAQARITSEVATRADADYALAVRSDRMETEYNGINVNVRALITDEARSRSEADGSFNDRIQQMTSEYQGIDYNVRALITQESGTRASADNAQTGRMDQMVSEYNGINTNVRALIESEAYTRYSENVAQNQRMDQMTTDYNGIDSNARALISQEAGTRSSVDSAQAGRMDQMTTDYNNINTNVRSLISEEAYTRSSVDGAQSGRMDQMVSEYNGIGSSLSITQGTVADIRGRTSAYFSVAAVSGDNRAQLVVHADANNGAGIDIIGDVRIGGNLLVLGSITADRIMNGFSNVASFGFNDILVQGAQAGVVMDTGFITIGDNVAGKGLFFINTLQDSTVTDDAYVLLNTYLTINGQGRQLIRSHRQGVRNSGGQATYVLPLSYSVNVNANTSIRIEVEAFGQDRSGANNKSVYLRNMRIDSMSMSR